MYHYNLNLFGLELRKIRKQLNLTLEGVSALSGINGDALGRIENGKVIPKYETLEYLSPIYKHDLNALLLKYRIDDYSAFYNAKTRLESKIDKDEFHTLDIEIMELEKLIESINSNFYKIYIDRLILLAKSIILYKKEHEYNKALNRLIEAMKLTNPSFIIDSYSSFVYSPMEIRILMNISFVLNRLGNKKVYLDIMEFCKNAVEPVNEIYPKLCYNLSSAYYRCKNFEKALELSQNGIKACQKSRNYNGLSLLYYNKGVSELKLDKEEYISSLKTAITFCEAFGQAELKNSFVKKCREMFNIEIDLA